MITLFNIDSYKIQTSTFANLLHDKIVFDFEERFAEYVGAKYAVSVNSATSAIFLLLLNKNITVKVPSMIPPVVLNAIKTSGNEIEFIDDTNWIGKSYILHDFGNYKIIDSAQQVYKNQFQEEAENDDIIVYSFYPTKPVGSCDGGMIVSNDYSKLEWFRDATMNGMSFASNNWEREIKFPGYKMYMNSLQAYIANKNLENLQYRLDKLDNIRQVYNNHFNCDNTSYHLYRIDTDNNSKFIDYMKKNGVICGIHYRAQHYNSIYTGGKIFQCPKSDFYDSRTVSIPFHSSLQKKDIRKIINLIESYV